MLQFLQTEKEFRIVTIHYIGVPLKPIYCFLWVFFFQPMEDAYRMQKTLPPNTDFNLWPGIFIWRSGMSTFLQCTNNLGWERYEIMLVLLTALTRCISVDDLFVEKIGNFFLYTKWVNKNYQYYDLVVYCYFFSSHSLLCLYVCVPPSPVRSAESGCGLSCALVFMPKEKKKDSQAGQQRNVKARQFSPSLCIWP